MIPVCPSCLPGPSPSSSPTWRGSTRLLHDLGDRYAEVLADHRRVLREAVERHGGVEGDTQGGAFFVAFAKAPDALKAAEEGRKAPASGPVRGRMGPHPGEPLRRGW